MALLSPREGSACRELLLEGFDPNSRLSRDETPLMQAAGRGQLAVCEMLIEAGADVKLGNESDRTALHLAAANGHDDVCKLLLAHGANLRAVTNTDGGSPLHWAAGRVDCAKVLIEAGASVHALTKWGNTPLHEAVGAVDEEVCRLMLDVGADPLIRHADCESDYLTPLERAVSNGNGKIARLLSEGLDIDPYGKTAGGVPLVDLAGKGADKTLVTFLAGLCVQRTELAVANGLNGVLEQSGSTCATSKRSFSPI
jgi:ankyrin repeat protein